MQFRIFKLRLARRLSHWAEWLKRSAAAGEVRGQSEDQSSFEIPPPSSVGGPPTHWIELVRRHAPLLFEDIRRRQTKVTNQHFTMPYLSSALIPTPETGQQQSNPKENQRPYQVQQGEASKRNDYDAVSQCMSSTIYSESAATPSFQGNQLYSLDSQANDANAVDPQISPNKQQKVQHLTTSSICESYKPDQDKTAVEAARTAACFVDQA